MSEQMPDFPRDTLPGVAAAPGKQESQTDLAEEDSQHNGHGTSHESQAGEGLEEASGLTTEDESTGDCGEGTFGDAQGSHEPNLVSIVTGDFAMQNVILQIGLQLVSPDGRQISRISRWALRCSACFKVTKVGLSYVSLCWDPKGNAFPEDIGHSIVFHTCTAMKDPIPSQRIHNALGRRSLQLSRTSIKSQGVILEHSAYAPLNAPLSKGIAIS